MILDTCEQERRLVGKITSATYLFGKAGDSTTSLQLIEAKQTEFITANEVEHVWWVGTVSPWKIRVHCIA